jgi:putative endonuclease
MRNLPNLVLKLNDMYKGGHVYIMTNKHHTVLYIGVTSDLPNRVYEHKAHLFKGSFSDRYNLEYLVYYETFEGIEEAIIRETEIKKWSRKKKEALINNFNPDWQDLYELVLTTLARY